MRGADPNVKKEKKKNLFDTTGIASTLIKGWDPNVKKKSDKERGKAK